MNTRYSDAIMLFSEVSKTHTDQSFNNDEYLLRSSLAFTLQDRIESGYYNNHGKALFNGKPEYWVLKTLGLCWQLRMSDREASSIAEISPTALSRYLKKNPEIKAYRDEMRNFIPRLAEQALVARLEYLREHPNTKSTLEILRVLQQIKPEEYKCFCKKKKAVVI